MLNSRENLQCNYSPGACSGCFHQHYHRELRQDLDKNQELLPGEQEQQNYFPTSLEHILLCHWAKAPSQMDREDCFIMLMICIFIMIVLAFVLVETL